MSYAAVAHHFWGQPGGGQLVCASVAHALNTTGFKPVLISVARFDSSKYSSWFGIDLSSYSALSLFNFELRVFGIYHRLLISFPLKKAVEKFSPSLVFIDVSTYRPVEDFLKRRVKLVEYIHFPFEVSVDPRYRGSHLYYGEDPYVLERYSKFPMNIYWWTYARLFPRFVRRNPFDVADAVLANSKWIAEVAESIYGERPQVLNPPIAPNVGIVSEPGELCSRKDAIVMVGRFSEEKRYHWVVERVMPRLSREVSGVKLYIFGGAGTRTSMSYISKVESVARRAGLRVSRSLEADVDVYLIPDAPRDAINKTADKSKVFIHATVNEHWGIAVAEAMARGLPVVVHRSGGTWSDLAAEGEYGLGYTDEEEAVELLARLLTDAKLWRSYSMKSIEKARELELNKFVEKFQSILKKIY